MKQNVVVVESPSKLKMIDIYENKKINYDIFFELAKKNKFYIDQNLYAKKIFDNNYGIFAKKDIKANQKIIKVPKKFLISKNLIRDFILEKKTNYPDIKLLNLYFLSLPNFGYFKKNNILFVDTNEKKTILEFFIDQSPTKRNIGILFDNFNNLDDVDKYIDLIFRSRAFNYNNISHLCPILDIVNYKYGEKKALSDDESFCCKNENLINCDEEFYQGYEDHSDIVNFYINYNFIPSVFNTVSIPSNFFSLNIPSNKKEQIDQKFWNILGNKISNKKKIVFENFITPIDFKFQMNSIVSNSIIEKNITKSVLELMKNEIKFENVSNYLKEESKKSFVWFFAHTLKVNYNNISQTIKNL